MSESGVITRMKRYGTLQFKKPPQPHMCIQVHQQDSKDVSYIDVLSWDEVALPSGPSEPIPFYGGMKISASRHEKNNVSVYAVIAHSEVLRINGKNAQDPQKRSTLIEDILDYVEVTNRNVKFMRSYSILKDRDITGELKKVWIAVQSRRDKENEIMFQQETWIDAQPDVPQYSESYENQQQQQQVMQNREMLASSITNKMQLLTQPKDFNNQCQQQHLDYQYTDSMKYDRVDNQQSYSSNSNVQIYQDKFNVQHNSHPCSTWENPLVQNHLQQQSQQHSQQHSEQISQQSSRHFMPRYYSESYSLPSYNVVDVEKKKTEESSDVCMMQMSQQEFTEYEIWNTRVDGYHKNSTNHKKNGHKEVEKTESLIVETESKGQLLQSSETRNMQVTDLDDDNEQVVINNSEVGAAENIKLDNNLKSKMTAETEIAKLSINDKKEKKSFVLISFEVSSNRKCCSSNIVN